MLNLLVLILFGYLVGSFSPGYFFGRLAKGIDIKKHGRHETGATNTYRLVGPAYGIVAGILDALKAVFVFYIAARALSFDLAILPGLAAVLGHNHPFYLNFKGGKGVASLLGLNFIVLIYHQSFYALLLLVGSLIYSVIISEEREEVWTAPLGRLAAKLSALALPIGYIWFSKEFFVSAVGVLLSVSLAFDVVRFLAPKINQWYLKLKKFAKDKELQMFSGYTLFLLSAFALFSFFPREIAVVSLVFFIVGDTLAPAGQLRYMMPHKKFLGNKTFGGAAVIFVFSLLSGLFLKSLTPLPISTNLVIFGGLATALFDQLSVFVDDNLLVPLGTATLLTFIV